MYDLFLTVLNQSIAASWLIAAVALLRPLLKKAPKNATLALWGLVALRLMVPLRLESAFSLVPSAQTFHAHNIQFETPAITSGIPAVDGVVNPILGTQFAPNPGGSVNPLYVWMALAADLWAVGVLALLVWALWQYARVRRMVAERVPYQDGSYLCDHLPTPFILGLFRPKIYLPSWLDADALGPVLAHEQAHLTRRDPWWKVLGFAVLSVHWFNPLCWLAYALLCKDIELACDEKAIAALGTEEKKQYSRALLACHSPQRRHNICPLAFGEVGVKERVKAVLQYRKPTFWAWMAAAVVCVVVAVCFLTVSTRGQIDLLLHLPADQTSFISEQEISSSSGVIKLTTGHGLADTTVQLVPTDAGVPAPAPQYLTPGMPVRFEVQPGAWYTVVVDPVSATSEEDVYLKIERVTVRIADQAAISMKSLKAQYPEYFGLSTFKGLEVYVWQMNENHYRFGLMEGTDREKTLEEKMALRGTTAEEMAAILDSYGLEASEITVIPWGNPISGYIVTQETVDDPAYLEQIRAMLGLTT